MKNLVIKEGKNTPEIEFNVESMEFSIKGRSFPENAKKFYQPVIDWLNELTPSFKRLSVEFQLYYISSSSVISMLEIINKFN